MEARREQALVGLFVLVAVALLLATVFTISGTFARVGRTYHADFKHAGGLDAGAIVRYAQGPRVGRVERVRIDPKDATQIEVSFSVKENVPIKSDTVAKVGSLSALGENYLELRPGKDPNAHELPPDSWLTSEDYVSFTEITDQINNLAPTAKELLENLNERVSDLQETIARVNDLLNERNRANLSATMGHMRGILEENRPTLRSTLGHMDTASAKLSPLLDDFKKAVHDANDAVSHIDTLIAEDRPELHRSLLVLHQTLTSLDSTAEQLDRTMTNNADGIDEILDNVRHITENLREFTETIKTRPNTLILSSGPRPRQPGAKPE